MKKSFKKLMRNQVQDTIDQFGPLALQPVPKVGWLRIVRKALGLTTLQLAKRVGSSQANITKAEKNESEGSISLKTLARIAEAMNCKFVYCIVPIKPIETILEERAKRIAKKRIQVINHSMSLELQGLTPEQLKAQEENLVDELLAGNLKKLWEDDYEV